MLPRAATSRRHAYRALCSFAAPPGAPGDRVLLRGLLFHAFHGVLPEERSLGQKFELDVALSVDTRRAGATDDLADTVSYADVYQLRPRPALHGHACALYPTCTRC